MRWLWMVLALALQTEPLPPAYPRPGTTSLIDNPRVFVWNIAWLKQTYPLHRHRYDLVGVYYTSGDRAIVSTEGARRPVSTKAWEIAFQNRGVTHIEEGASDSPLRAVFAELKEEAARNDAEPATPESFPRGAGKQLLDNARTTVWEFAPPLPASSPRHRHGRDAVVVSFAAGNPTAEFISKGTTHQGDGAAGAERVYVYELK